MQMINRLNWSLWNDLFNKAARLNSKNIVLGVFILTWAVFCSRNLLGMHYTGWDTHDLGFIYFLYFSDSLHSGTIPFWNPFIQAGTFHAGLFNAGNYSPFQGVFFLLSQFINPVYIYELMIQVVMVIGVMGFYLWLRSLQTNKLVSIFGAQTFFLGILMPLVGQIMFLFSLSALPWILFVCQKAAEETSKIEYIKYLFFGALISSFMASGYPWMNLINFTIFFFYAIHLIFKNKSRNSSLHKIIITPTFLNLSVFALGAGLVISCYYAPGYFSLKFYYHLFNGDYVSPEPRLRGLAPVSYQSFQGIKEALFMSIDPRVFLNDPIRLKHLPIWTWGVGWTTYLLLFYKKPDLHFFRKNWIWVISLVFALMYSAGDLKQILGHLPLYNANRWWFIGLVYVYISAVVLSVDRLQPNVGTKKSKLFENLFFLIGFISAITTLALFKAPFYEYALVISITAVIYYLTISKSQTQWALGLSSLMCLNMISFITMQHTMPGASRSQQILTNGVSTDYYNKISIRNKSTSVYANYRQLGQAREYIFNNEDWITKKIPYSHGYNPLGNPLYWYVKDAPYLKHFVDITQIVREEKRIFRKDYSSDIGFAKALVQDIQSNAKIPTVNTPLKPELLSKKLDFRWDLNHLKIVPNRVEMK
ncbi:MAG: hypothetical protein EPN84_02220, partial [Legionella sp.]